MRTVSRHVTRLTIAAVLVAATYGSGATCLGAILFQSAAIGPTGVTLNQLLSQQVPGSNVNSGIFAGARFELTVPATLERVGGHLLGYDDFSNLFAAIVKLDGPDDYPDSFNLDTPDVLATALITWPRTASDQAFAGIQGNLSAGNYAIVFGSGLFGATGGGIMVLNGVESGAPTYINRQSNIGELGWDEMSPPLRNYNFVVEGHFVPEPSSVALAAIAALFARRRRAAA